MKKRAGGSRMWAGAAVAVVLLGMVVLVVGVVDRRWHLVFGGTMFLLIAAGLVAQARALRPGRDDAVASNAERAAWSQLGVGLGAILVLGGISLGSAKGSFAPYLLFATYALIVALYPGFRRRWVEETRRHCEVPEDERDRALRAQGDYLAKRLLEFALVGMATAWVLVPRFFQSLGGPVQIAALLLLPVLAANVAGEARVALLHWRDRQ